VWTVKTKSGGGVITLGGGTAISGADTGCGMPFRPVPAEFNHCALHGGQFRCHGRSRTCCHLVSRTLVSVVKSSSQVLRLGCLCKPTDRMRF